MKSESQKLKYEALLWLRIKQRCPFIATEVGAHSADVLGINEKKMVEIEVKISMEDLEREFKNKVYKHSQYTGDRWDNGTWQAQWIPNYFYFAMPTGMIEKSRAILSEETKGKYGIITLDGFRVVKRAKALHERTPNNHVKLSTALRMGSELIRFHEAWV